ncbi:hypothetical protein [Rickettsia endosymbiont of Cantharis rufa]|uniref:hypothetical protein n=1 Tax=Rickettsia endosymbiont of Cantharis rufa TaxID=3066248 RepID=UPI003132A888
MNTKTVAEKIEPYLDFLIKDKDLLREIYPNGMGVVSIELILAKKPYNTYACYKLIRTLFKFPYRKIILIIDKTLLKASLSLVRSIILGTLSYQNLVKIFICDENNCVLNMRALKSSENYFLLYKINYFKKTY